MKHVLQAKKKLFSSDKGRLVTCTSFFISFPKKLRRYKLYISDRNCTTETIFYKL